MIVLTEKELEDLKRQIKSELIAESGTLTRNRIPLEGARATWFLGEGGLNKYEGSAMYQLFGPYRMHRVWDEVRKLTTHIFRKQYTNQLVDFDLDVCEMVCDTLCRTIVDLCESEEVKSQIDKQV